MDAWADDAAAQLDPDKLWEDLAARGAALEELQEKVAGLQGDLDMARGAGGVTGNRAPPVPDDSQQSEEIVTRLAELEKAF